jgi:hypothetical protein
MKNIQLLIQLNSIQFQDIYLIYLAFLLIMHILRNIKMILAIITMKKSLLSHLKMHNTMESDSFFIIDSFQIPFIFLKLHLNSVHFKYLYQTFRKVFIFQFYDHSINLLHLNLQLDLFL